MSGYLKIYRRFYGSDLWQEPREFSRAEAWLDLLGLAAWGERTVSIGGRSWTLDPGEVITSRPFLATRWNWTRARVRRFLEYLVEARRISYEPDGIYTRIHISNYQRYQEPKPAEEKATDEEKKAIEELWNFYLQVRVWIFAKLERRNVVPKLTKSRRSLLLRRIREYGAETVREAIRRVWYSDFHCARNRFAGGQIRLSLEAILDVNRRINQVENLANLEVPKKVRKASGDPLLRGV